MHDRARNRRDDDGVPRKPSRHRPPHLPPGSFLARQQRQHRAAVVDDQHRREGQQRGANRHARHRQQQRQRDKRKISPKRSLHKRAAIGLSNPKPWPGNPIPDPVDHCRHGHHA